MTPYPEVPPPTEMWTTATIGQRKDKGTNMAHQGKKKYGKEVAASRSCSPWDTATNMTNCRTTHSMGPPIKVNKSTKQGSLNESQHDLWGTTPWTEDTEKSVQNAAS